MKAVQSDGDNVPDGSRPEADDSSDEAEEVDEATSVKRQMLVKAAPLAGTWGLERFGFTDTTVLKLLEALQGELAIKLSFGHLSCGRMWQAFAQNATCLS